MNPHIELFLRLNKSDQQIVRSAANAGDSPLTRSVFKLYFPKLSQLEIIAFIADLRGTCYRL